MKDVNSLSHTFWNCKYHIVFAPKYRRRVFYGQKRREIGAILRQLCEWKNVETIEAEVCPGCRGYYVDTVGKNTAKIKEYIANQIEEDKTVEQMTITELLDPFKQ